MNSQPMQNRFSGYKDITFYPKKNIAEVTSSVHKSNFTHSGCFISVNSLLSVKTLKPLYWVTNKDVSSSIVNQDTYWRFLVEITNSLKTTETLKENILPPVFTKNNGKLR